ncbi:molybdopterin synthase [Halobacteriales archaeon QS_1_68_20]|nr:MAG: molybdopterin synthase [Halobacteriales archaeon QS_1_68_20]
MKVLGVVGADRPEAASLVERLADRIDGRVATVRRSSDPAETGREADSPAVETTYRLGDDGDWVATGMDETLADVLAGLAPDHDYALVEGFPGADLPTVVLGDAESTGEPLVTAADATSVDADGVLDRLEETEPFETLESLVAAVKRSPDAERAGAIATFTGRVRAKDSPDDEPTEYLSFEKYEGVADERMATLREELEARDGVQAVRLHHRTGVIEYGEDIVFVVVLAGHREEAFRTVEDGIDRLKEEVPLFKKEVTVDEEFWVHERA